MVSCGIEVRDEIDLLRFRWLESLSVWEGLNDHMSVYEVPIGTIVSVQYTGVLQHMSRL